LRLHLKRWPSLPTWMPSFDFLPFGSKLSWVTGMLVAGDDVADFRPFGTGFLTGPRMALTARHVVDDMFLHFTGVLPPALRGPMPFGVQLGTADVRTGGLVKWDVLGYHYSQAIDITGLVIEPAGVARLHQVYPKLNVIPPRPGEDITAYGYPNATWKPVSVGTFKVTVDPRLAAGIVKDVHLQYRDRSFLPFPCFHTNARFDPGMSGGPVFNTDGQVCGVICCNLPPAAEGEDHASYVSLIWPALGLRLTPRFTTDSTFIRDEAVLGRIRVLNLDYMTVTPDTPSDRIHFGPPRHDI
jgi:hypothetical protein